LKKEIIKPDQARWAERGAKIRREKGRRGEKKKKKKNKKEEKRHRLIIPRNSMTSLAHFKRGNAKSGRLGPHQSPTEARQAKSIDERLLRGPKTRKCSPRHK